MLADIKPHDYIHSQKSGSTAPFGNIQQYLNVLRCNKIKYAYLIKSIEIKKAKITTQCYPDMRHLNST